MYKCTSRVVSFAMSRSCSHKAHTSVSHHAISSYAHVTLFDVADGKVVMRMLRADADEEAGTFFSPSVGVCVREGCVDEPAHGPAPGANDAPPPYSARQRRVRAASMSGSDSDSCDEDDDDDMLLSLGAAAADGGDAGVGSVRVVRCASPCMMRCDSESED